MKLYYYSLFLFILVLLFHNSYSTPKVSALSHIFSRQEIADTPHAGYDINLNTNTIRKAHYSNAQDDPPDLRYVDYFSNGKTLNATLWLAKEFQSKPSINEDFHYGMLIDADSNPKTGLEGVDYQVDIQFNSTTKKWEKLLLDYSTLSNATHRTLSNERYTNFYEPLHNFVSVYVNLDAISAPNKYKVMFYAYVYYTQAGYYVADFSNWVDIPPPTYFVSTSQDPLQLRPGENKTIGAQLKSTTGTVPNLVGFTTIDNPLPIKVNINSDKLNKSQSIEPTSFDIAALNKAPVGQYTVPLLANISEGSTFLPEFLQLKNYTLSVPTDGYMLTPVNLTVSVLEPLTFQQWFKEGWDTYGSLISLLAGGFAAGAASLVFDRLRNTRRHNDPNLDKH